LPEGGGCRRALGCDMPLKVVSITAHVAMALAAVVKAPYSV
jgi:hypothetical protein